MKMALGRPDGIEVVLVRKLGPLEQQPVAIARILSRLEQLCSKDDADQLMSGLLRKFDSVTGLSAWSDPSKLH